MADGGRMLEEQATACLARVTYTKDFALLGQAEIIWEAATERIDVKKVIFGNIEKHADPKKLVFIFSNTSSHTTAELAVLFNDMFLRDKFLTGHGYFPFHANRLFDVMKGKYAIGRDLHRRGCIRRTGAGKESHCPAERPSRLCGRSHL